MYSELKSVNDFSEDQIENFRKDSWKKFQEIEKKRANRVYRFMDDLRSNFKVKLDEIYYKHIFLSFYDCEGKFKWKLNVIKCK